MIYKGESKKMGEWKTVMGSMLSLHWRIICGPRKMFVMPDVKRRSCDTNRRLIDLLHTGTLLARAAREATRCTTGTTSATREAARSTASSAVKFLHDGVGDGLELLLLPFVLLLRGLLRGIQPGDGLVDGSLELGLVGGVELVSELLVVHGIAEVVGVRLESVLGGDASSSSLILCLVPLGLLDHAFDLLLGEATLVVGDGDAVRLAGGLVGGGYIEDTIGVDVKGDFNLRNTTRSGGDARQLEFTEQVVVLCTSTLTLVHLDEDTRLVIGVGGEDLRLFGGNSGVAFDEGGHNTTSGLDTEGKRGNIEKEQVLSLLGGVSGKNGGLDSGTVGDSLVGVDALVGLLAVEEVGHELDDTGDTGGATDEDDFVHVALIDLGVAEDFLNGLERAAEEVLAELLEASSGDGSVEVDTLVQGVDLNGGLGGGR